MQPNINYLSRHSVTSTLLMFTLLIFEMSTDIYISSLPEMTRFFQVTDAMVQTTVSAYLLGFSTLGLVGGPLSDRIGRRPVILTSITLFAISSITCWLAPSIVSLIIARFAQGMGAGITLVVSTALLKDIYDEKNFSRILSTMGMIIALSPMIAPLIGGKIAHLWGWQSCFLMIAVMAGIIWVTIILFLQESLKPEHRLSTLNAFSSRHLLTIYGNLMRRPEIVAFALISAIAYGGLWTWIVEAPFYMINVVGIKNVDYGYYAAISPGAYIVGTFLNRRCVHFYGVERMLALGLILMTLGAGASLISTFYWPLSLIALYISFSIYAIGLAPVFANAVTKAIAVKPSQRGSASALLNMLEMGIASLSTLFVGIFTNSTLIPCMSIILGSSVLCTLIFITIQKMTHKSTMNISG